METCYTGDIFSGLESVTTDLAHTSMTALGSSLALLIGAWAAVYFAWHTVQAIGGRFDPQTGFIAILTQLGIYVFVGTLLAGGAATQFWWPVFDFLKDLGPWAGSVILAASSTVELQGQGISGLLCTTESVFNDRIFTQLRSMTDDVSWTAALTVWGGVLLLVVVFVLLIWKMIKSVIGSYFKIMGIGILSPFIVAALADKNTRPITTHGIKIMVSGAFELFLASAAASAVLILMEGVLGLLESPPGEGANILFSQEYWTLLLTGLFLVVVYDQLMSVAGQLMQVFGQSAQNAVQPMAAAASAAGFVTSAANPMAAAAAQLAKVASKMGKGG